MLSTHSFTTMAGLKRSRSFDEDEPVGNDYGQLVYGTIAGHEFKRPRNDTLLDLSQASSLSTMWQPPTPGIPSPVGSQEVRPAPIRAQTLPFRLPSDPASAVYQSPTTAASGNSSATVSPASVASLVAFPDSPDASPPSVTSLPAFPDSADASPASMASLPPFSDSPDMDMDDQVRINNSPSPPSTYHSWRRPAKLHPQSLEPSSPRNLSASGRVPTPRFGTFSSHLLSPHDGFYPTPRLGPFSGPLSAHLPSPHEGIFASPRFGTLSSHLLSPHPGINTPPNSAFVPSHSPHLPLPSPIKEEEMDAEMAGTQLSRLSMSGEDGMDIDSVTAQPVQPPGSLLPRRTRQRSGAITAGPGTRKIVSGYLEGCEKCRNKTPGHLMHFLPA